MRMWIRGTASWRRVINGFGSDFFFDLVWLLGLRDGATGRSLYPNVCETSSISS